VARPLHHGVGVHAGVDVLLHAAAPQVVRGAGRLDRLRVVGGGTGVTDGDASAVPDLLEVAETRPLTALLIQAKGAAELAWKMNGQSGRRRACWRSMTAMSSGVCSGSTGILTSRFVLLSSEQSVSAWSIGE
jgi:hypothetical protein